MIENQVPALLKYPDVRHLLDVILLRIQNILGEKLVGLYLYGSFIAGDFDYPISDLDLLAATATAINEQELGWLVNMHADLVKEHHEWDNRIEIAYVSLDALKTFKTLKTQIANISPGEPLHFLEAGRDWLLNWYFVRENSMTLFGDSPERIIDFISKEEFIEAVREQALERGVNVERAKHSRPYQAYLIMTLCRALYSVQHGEQVSKKRAAQWAQKQFPEHTSLIENAFEWRVRHREKILNHEATFPETKKFIHFIIDRIKD